MQFVCKRSGLNGKVAIPGSKSHTIRALFIAAQAEGTSIIDLPLVSADALAALNAVRVLGADVEVADGSWRVAGFGRQPKPREQSVDVGNSGTTLRILLGAAARLEGGEVELTGDAQIQKRPAGPLVDALNELGADISALRGNGCAPFRVRGTLQGGQTRLEAKSSQYVTSLLMTCPLAEKDTVLEVPLLNEKAYVQITLDWLDEQGVKVEHENMRRFFIPGSQAYKPFAKTIPADFSTATFFLGAGALGSNRVVCTGLDRQDSQPDKAVIDYLQAMGAAVETGGDGSITVAASELRGMEIDMNETPDALPVMAVVGCFAKGETRLTNVAHARIKETDRIAVMCKELRRMGADIEELEDGLIIRESDLNGAEVDGHGDHRVVMALALAGLSCPGTTVVHSAEAAGVTFPEFAEFMQSLGADLVVQE